MRFLGRSLSGLFLVALTLALLALAAETLRDAIVARNAPPGPAQPPAERVFTAAVMTLTPARIAPVMTAFGEVRSRRTLELRAAAAGEIVELAPEFADGTEVAAGQLLVRIDPADARSARDAAQSDLQDAGAELADAGRAVELGHADLAAAEAQENLRRRAVERQKGLGSRGVGTAADLETAELALSAAVQGTVSRQQALAAAEGRADRARNTLDRQRLALADAERRLTETELRAGFAGVLSSVTVVAGGLVAKNEKLGELIDPEALEVAFRVSTAQYLRLIDGAGALRTLPVNVALDTSGSGLSAAGRIERVDAAVGQGSSGRLIFAALTETRGFRPGDFAILSVTEPVLDGVAEVPARALGADGTLLVLGENNRLEAVRAEVLREQGDSVILRVGALAGREIVTERTALLGAGILVRPVRADGAALSGGAGRDVAGLGGDEAAAPPARPPGG